MTILFSILIIIKVPFKKSKLRLRKLAGLFQQRPLKGLVANWKYSVTLAPLSSFNLKMSGSSPALERITFNKLMINKCVCSAVDPECQCCRPGQPVCVLHHDQPERRGNIQRGLHNTVVLSALLNITTLKEVLVYNEYFNISYLKYICQFSANLLLHSYNTVRLT